MNKLNGLSDEALERLEALDLALGLELLNHKYKHLESEVLYLREALKQHGIKVQAPNTLLQTKLSN